MNLPPVIPSRALKQSRGAPWIVALLIVVSLIALLFAMLPGSSGKTRNASKLHKVFRKAGPDFEFVYTNGLSEFLTSKGEVSWNHFSGRGDSITVTGQLDPVAFARFMTNHPSIRFYATSQDVGFRWIADTGDREIITDASVNMFSGKFWLSTGPGIYKHGNQ